MRNRLVILLALLGLTSVGCANERADRPEPATRAQAQHGEDPSGAADPAVPPQPGQPGAPAVPSPVDPSAPPAVAGATGAVQNTRTMEEVGMAIEAAIAAAAAIPVNGEDQCSVAYRGLETMMTELHQRMPEQPTNPLPPRDAFLEICRDMSPEVQQCLVVAYAVEHQEECERHSANLDPAVRARIDALMGTAAAPPAAAP